MNTEPVSADQAESTRKIGARIQGEILRRLAEVTQERAADRMGVSASTVSRQKESLDGFCQLLAALGLQLASTDAVVVDQQELLGIERMALKYLQARVEAENRRAQG
ncbi:CII family transcriptional regulator [Neopusillimonas aromaticivorans]|uniref:CII family transcriptional regulator n=1 Tax=Neopusillimonas aromaticivorans TaxID=2979868 RepID=UPI0025921675|nr:CII family transcriptional regulator [Neopusillimonas aromaticivorans]WJJ93424.1 CII family transcriptional regulator [Neopusillimonas aromaticivorans]